MSQIVFDGDSTGWPRVSFHSSVAASQVHPFCPSPLSSTVTEAGAWPRASLSAAFPAHKERAWAHPRGAGGDGGVCGMRGPTPTAAAHQCSPLPWWGWRGAAGARGAPAQWVRDGRPSLRPALLSFPPSSTSSVPGAPYPQNLQSLPPCWWYSPARNIKDAALRAAWSLLGAHTGRPVPARVQKLGASGGAGRGSAGGLLWRAAFKLKSKGLKEPGEEGKRMREWIF